MESSIDSPIDSPLINSPIDDSIDDSVDSIDSNADICPICLEELTKNLAVLNCNHKYHFDCIKMWYKQQKKTNKLLNCPLCHNEYAEIVNILYVDEPNRMYSNTQLRPTAAENRGEINVISSNRQNNMETMCCVIL